MPGKSSEDEHVGPMKSTYSREQPFLAGETITGGDFVCTECGYELRMKPGHVSNLPVCPQCQNDRWEPG